MSKFIKVLLKWTLFLVVLAFAVHALTSQFAKVDFATVQFDPLLLVLAAGCLLLVPPMQLITYRTLLGAYAQSPPLRVMMVVAWVPPLGKYIPGKVSSLLGAYYILRKFDIPAAIGLSVVLAMDGLAVVTGLIVGSPLISYVIPNGVVFSAVMIIFGTACLHPAIFTRLLNFVLIRLKRQPLDHRPDLRHYLLPVLCSFGQWVAAGVALWLVARSVAMVSVDQIPRFISIAGLGYTISYLALFAPGGLGPREIIFQRAIAPLMVPAAISAVVVVVLRIIQTCTELSAAVVGLLILRRLDQKKRPPAARN